ncbi:MAG TPA: cupin domain-containing protein, partial [Miltoncostaeaceae bacterium]|nr:cupin domain-containing protein [Miltoncostaeaceae bacterium]
TTSAPTAAPRRYAFLGGVVTVLLDGAATEGRQAVLEQRLPDGTATPLHVHDAEDETFLVLEGAITVLRGDTTLRAGAGDVVFLPRGVPHAFRVDTPEALLVDIVGPAGHERFFALAGEEIPPGDAAAADRPVDPARMMAAAAATGLRILGPPPFDAA